MKERDIKVYEFFIKINYLDRQITLIFFRSTISFNKNSDWIEYIYIYILFNYSNPEIINDILSDSRLFQIAENIF